jgi:hypothetical protein
MRSGHPTNVSVIGHVSLWGKVIEHERGFRAKYAYPARLRLICAVCLRRGSGEATPFVVHHVDGSGVMIAACRFHDDEIPPGTVLDPDDVLEAVLSRYAVDVLPLEPLRPLFSFPKRAPTMSHLAWPALEELRALSREVPPTAPSSREVDVRSPHDASVRPVVPGATVAPSPAVRRSAPPPPEPLAIRALKAIGVGIGWLLQAAFFLLLFFVGCADTFQVVSVQP